ncbi:MAG: serine protease [Lachnospiraceae bacterium]|nr:serine protease [Lachnospiraceae bacterium]
MKIRKIKRFAAITVVITMLCASLGCRGVELEAISLMDGTTVRNIETVADMDTGNVAVTEFALKLFKESMESDKNMLISPLSVLCALAMTTNGADGETLKQMEEVLGMTADELNLYIHSYMENLPETEKYKLKLANSIWFTDDERFTVNQDFLQTNADYYGADIYKAPFDDTTLEDINNWVSDNTDEMIEDILDKIPDAAVMYLVNALAFEAEWQDIYLKTQVSTGRFKTEDGTAKNVEFMYSQEHVYLEDENATGFMKFYKDRKYAFVALLPNEGVSVKDYMETLTGEEFADMLANHNYTAVSTAIPKFETEYDVEMADVLKNLGMTDAFDMNAADFTKLGESSEGNIFINRVIHKTFISVGEKGTKAGAATVVETEDGAMAVEPKTVYLDRPFVYMLIDCENNIPFFIGTFMDVE